MESILQLLLDMLRKGMGKKIKAWAFANRLETSYINLGNLDPLGKGMADGAFLYVYSSSNNNYYDVPTIYQNNDVVITSKS